MCWMQIPMLLFLSTLRTHCCCNEWIMNLIINNELFIIKSMTKCITPNAATISFNFFFFLLRFCILHSPPIRLCRLWCRARFKKKTNEKEKTQYHLFHACRIYMAFNFDFIPSPSPCGVLHIYLLTRAQECIRLNWVYFPIISFIVRFVPFPILGGFRSAALRSHRPEIFYVISYPKMYNFVVGFTKYQFWDKIRRSVFVLQFMTVGIVGYNK